MSNLSTKWLKVSEPVAHVLLVELARTPVNAFNTEFWTQYGNLFDTIPYEAPDARVVVLCSSVQKIFTAGLDLSDTSTLSDASAPDPARRAIGLRDHVLNFQSAITAPDRCPIPVIVAVHGLVLGLGMDIIGACDIRYAATNTTFSIKEVDVGLAADIGTLSFLPKITGNSSVVRELAYTARDFGAAEADKLGLLSRVVEGGRDEVVAAALELAKVIAKKSPYAVMSTKRILTHSRDHSVPQNLEYTATWNSVGLQAKDTLDSMLAYKRKTVPQFAPLRAKKPQSKL